MHSAQSLSATAPDLSIALLLVLAILAPIAIWFGSWVERIALSGLGVIMAILASLELVFGPQSLDHPSPMLLAGLELLALLFFMALVLIADRRFPFFMAAAALIGLCARLLTLAGLTSRSIDLLAFPRLGGLIMTLALAGGLASRWYRLRANQPRRLLDQAA